MLCITSTYLGILQMTKDFIDYFSWSNKIIKKKNGNFFERHQSTDSFINT